MPMAERGLRIIVANKALGNLGVSMLSYSWYYCVMTVPERLDTGGSRDPTKIMKTLFWEPYAIQPQSYSHRV